VAARGVGVDAGEAKYAISFMSLGARPHARDRRSGQRAMTAGKPPRACDEPLPAALTGRAAGRT
jgi:hypothetical protein